MGSQVHSLGATLLLDLAMVARAEAIAQPANQVPFIDLTVRKPDLDCINQQVYEQQVYEAGGTLP